MLYLEAFEDRLLMSSMMSLAPLDVGLLPISPEASGNPGALPVLNAALSPAVAASPNLSLSGLSLVNCSTNQVIGPLVNGETIDLANYP